MKKLVVLLLIAFTLTGCGQQQVALTEDQTTLIARYAADCLLRYQKNYTGGLLDAEQIAEEEKKEARKLEIQQKVEELKASSTENNGNENSEGTGSQAKTLKEVLQFSDFDIQYTGYEVKEAYNYSAEEENMPEEEEPSEDFSLSLNATPNKKLIVLKFRLQNLTGEEKPCDVLRLTPRFKITVNEEKRISTMLTMLPNDLSGFSQTIPASSSTEVVLVGQVGDEYADNITSLKLKVTCGAESTTLSLE